MLKSLTMREKSAWVMTLLLGFAGWLYVAPIVIGLANREWVVPPPGRSALAFVIIVVILSIISHIIVAIVDPKTANQPADERDRWVANWSGHWSGMVFGFLAVTSLMLYLVHRSGDFLFHTVFSSLILSQIAEYVLVIIAYRRGV